MNAKEHRQNYLIQLIEENPFLTDQELSTLLKVSIQTVRLDRLTLGISELRERIRSVASENYDKVQSISRQEIVGDIIHLQVGEEAISILHTEASMAFEKSHVVKGSTIFAMAESLALASIEQRVALSGVANLKYQVPVMVGEVLVARALVREKRNNEYIIHVTIRVHSEQVFRAKFMMRPVGEKNETGN